MRILLLLIISSHFAIGQNNSKVTPDNIFADPFNLGSNPLDSLRSTFSPNVEYRTVLNDNIDGQIDTIFNLNIGNDTLTIFKKPDENWLIKAYIKDKTFTLKETISIGDSRSKVSQALLNFEGKTFYSTWIYQDEDLLQQIEFKYESDRLTLIHFQGYYD